MLYGERAWKSGRSLAGGASEPTRPACQSLAACGPSCGGHPGRVRFCQDGRAGPYRSRRPAILGGEFLAGEHFSARSASSVNTRHTRRWSLAESRAEGLGVIVHPTSRLAGSTSPFIQDLVAVALFGEEHLAVVGEVEFAGVARDKGIEVGESPSPFALGRRMRPSRCASS